MDLVEVEQPYDVTRRPLQDNTAAGAQLAGSRPGFFRPGLQLGSMAARGILEAIEHFVKAWMRLKHHLTTTLRGHIHADKESANDSPDNLTGRGRPLMWPIVEFVGRDCPQDAPGEA